MRPPSGGCEDVPDEVLMPQTPTRMAPLHSPSTPLTPVSLAAQRLSTSRSRVPIEMPLLTNEMQWQTRTLSRQRRIPTRARRSLDLNRAGREIASPWQDTNHVYDMYISGAGSAQHPRGVEDRPIINIESHNSSISNVSSPELCRHTSETAQGTNMIVSDSLDMQHFQEFLKVYSLDADSSNCFREQNVNIAVCEATGDDDMSLPLNSFRALSVPTILQQPTAAAKKLASKIIRHAYFNKVPNENDINCPDCGLIPIHPVTGQCGHTRCNRCIADKGACFCGVPEPESIHVNILVQNIITKMVRHCALYREKLLASFASTSSDEPVASTSSTPVRLHRSARCNSRRYRRLARTYASLQIGDMSRHTPDLLQSLPMSMQARYEMGRKFMSVGRYREAAPLLAHVAASTEVTAKHARNLLAQAITVMNTKMESRRVARELYRAVREHAARSWLDSTDLECVLCCSAFTEPVTTGCGHTYCRTCLERSLDYRRKCPLCLRPLDNFNLSLTRETAFVTAALASIDAVNPPLQLDPDVIPIFVCTVAYPSIPCPLFVFDPRYWLMVRRVLESGSRKFGMVSFERDRSYSSYGTILQVCDCVHLEDGRSILSTVGISRFKVISQHTIDGCEMARIEQLQDIIPTDPLVVWELRLAGAQICYKALLWLNRMRRSIFAEIESTFGRMPEMNAMEGNWWESPDGPAWLWWLIAILPLKTEIKVLILSTQSLLKRMTAIYRTLEAIDQINTADTTAMEVERALNTTEEWLRRQP